jgi:hypothetical protein
MKKTITIIAAVFGIIGLGLLIGDCFFYSSTQKFISKAKSAQGTVTDLIYKRSSSSSSSSSNSGSYFPVIQFQDEKGEQVVFQSSTGSNPPSYSVGQAVEILFDPANPQDARVNSFFSKWGGVFVMTLLGVVFFLIGAGIFGARILFGRKKDWLKQNGQSIATEVQDIILNKGVQVNGRSPFQIISQWKNPQTGAIHTFKSESIWYDPKQYITGKSINVLIDPANPKKYWMDISFLPKEA